MTLKEGAPVGARGDPMGGAQGGDEYMAMGLAEYSSLIGEPLSKQARHRLTLLCIKGITEELSDRGLDDNKRVGRPSSAASILASEIGVTQKTVHRWTNPEDIQATDENADKLAEIAYKFYPEETAGVLRGDVDEYRRRLELWISLQNNGLSPYPNIQRGGV